MILEYSPALRSYIVLEKSRIILCPWENDNCKKDCTNCREYLESCPGCPLTKEK